MRWHEIPESGLRGQKVFSNAWRTTVLRVALAQATASTTRLFTPKSLPNPILPSIRPCLFYSYRLTSLTTPLLSLDLTYDSSNPHSRSHPHPPTAGSPSLKRALNLNPHSRTDSPRVATAPSCPVFAPTATTSSPPIFICVRQILAPPASKLYAQNLLPLTQHPRRRRSRIDKNPHHTPAADHRKLRNSDPTTHLNTTTCRHHAARPRPARRVVVHPPSKLNMSPPISTPQRPSPHPRASPGSVPEALRHLLLLPLPGTPDARPKIREAISRERTPRGPRPRTSATMAPNPLSRQNWKL